VPSEPTLRARLATEYRRRNRDPERIAAARRELAAQQIRDHITRITASAPPLTVDQRRELVAQLLAPEGGGAGAAA
jgi:hypothetical protein